MQSTTDRLHLPWCSARKHADYVYVEAAMLRALWCVERRRRSVRVAGADVRAETGEEAFTPGVGDRKKHTLSSFIDRTGGERR